MKFLAAVAEGILVQNIPTEFCYIFFASHYVMVTP